MSKLDLNIYSFGGMIVATLCIYYLLLQTILFSIPSALTYINHWMGHWHGLAVGLLPVYVGLLVFGTGVAGVYLGNILQRWIVVRTGGLRCKERI